MTCVRCCGYSLVTEPCLSCPSLLKAESSMKAAEGLFCPSCKDNTRTHEDEEWCYKCEKQMEMKE